MHDTYLVTGGTGFIGTNIVRALVRRKKSVHVLVRNKTLNWRLSDIADTIKVHEADLLDPGLPSLVARIRPTVVFHAAAYGALPNQNSRDALINVNIKGTLRLLEAVRTPALKIIVNTGSSSEYGVNDHPMKETDALVPVNDYGITKAAATLFCRSFAANENVPVVTLRLFSPYGPYEESSRFMPYVIRSMLAGTPIELSNPAFVRDFIYIDDVVDAYLKAATTPPDPGTVVNIGSGEERSLGDAVKVIRMLTGSKAPVTWNPKNAQVRQKEPLHWRADISLAENVLGWKPKHSLESGLKHMIAWYNRNLC